MAQSLIYKIYGYSLFPQKLGLFIIVDSNLLNANI